MWSPLAQAAALFFAISICAADFSTTDDYSSVNNLNDLLPFLQPNDVGESYEFSTDFYNCTRKCEVGDYRICYYQFHAENYATLNRACLNCLATGQSCDLPQCVTADGFEKGILTVNRRLPGPSIQVCEGDRIVVDVINKMSGRSFSVHWHGLFQKDTPYYDGVPMITQCSILEDDTFRYNFNASQSGTFFWHSHHGIQKLHGLQGSLIIRRPQGQDPNENLYDEDLPAHAVVIMDWFHVSTDNQYPGILDPSPEQQTTHFLINGRGRYLDTATNSTSNSPYTVYHVTKGKRYRFRIIGATCDVCYVRFSIEGHRLKIISTDGNSIKPVVVDYVDISSAERYDFVLEANQEINAYWIRISPQGFCATFKNFQLAILKYEGSDYEEPTTEVKDEEDFHPDGVGLNVPSTVCNETITCLTELEANENFNEGVLNSEPYATFEMNLGFYFYSVEELYQSNTYDRFFHPGGAIDLALTVNNISYVESPSPLISQRGDIPPDVFCPVDDNGMPYCDQSHCKCTHLWKIPRDVLIQVIMVDRSNGGSINHPIHLHGFAFNVMAMGLLEDVDNNIDLVKELMKTNNLTKSPAPTLKDTVIVPSGGFTVIRFFSDNPGYWFMHCHFLFHHITGMAFTIQVGDKEAHPPLPANFPKCGNHLPSVDFSGFNVC